MKRNAVKENRRFACWLSERTPLLVTLYRVVSPPGLDILFGPLRETNAGSKLQPICCYQHGKEVGLEVAA